MDIDTLIEEKENELHALEAQISEMRTAPYKWMEGKYFKLSAYKYMKIYDIDYVIGDDILANGVLANASDDFFQIRIGCEDFDKRKEYTEISEEEFTEFIKNGFDLITNAIKSGK